MSGSIRDIAVQLRQVHLHYSWDNPVNTNFTLAFSLQIPWKDNLATHHGLTRVEVEAIKWWLESTKFTAWHGTTGSGYSHRSCMKTFVEIALALEIETGIHLGGPNADLARKTTLLRAGMRFLMSNCKPRTNDPKCKKSLTFDGFFCQKKYVGTLEVITSQRMAGIYRGIAWRHGSHQAGTIAAVSYLAGLHYVDLIRDQQQDTSISGLHNRLPAFGSSFIPKLRDSGIPAAWRAPVLVALESQVVQAYANGRPQGGTCHFGCASQAKLKTQSLVPRWRGAPL